MTEMNRQGETLYRYDNGKCIVPKNKAFLLTPEERLDSNEQQIDKFLKRSWSSELGQRLAKEIREKGQVQH